MSDTNALLARAVTAGIITQEQRAAIEALAGHESSSSLSGVTVAYGLGALLVLFASGWFLVSRWETLGPWGVLAIAACYATLFIWLGARVKRMGYPRAGDLLLVLAIGLTPLVAWSLMRLAGEWPPQVELVGLVTTPWMRTRFLVLDLSTILAALLTWRVRRFPALMLPLGVALWWAWLHLSQLLEIRPSNEWYDRWVMLAAGLALLALADSVERWQRRDRQAAAEGDYAAMLWLVGGLAFAFAYLVIWLRLDDGQHTLLPVALLLVALFIRTRRRVLLVFGGLGVFGYLAWLASEVFKDGALFPIALIAIGVTLIATTVWAQRRFPSLFRGSDQSGRVLPWPVVISWVPVVVTVGLALVALATSEGDPDQARFKQQWERMRTENRTPRPNSVPR